MNAVILQNPSSFETRAIHTAVMIMDEFLVMNSKMEDLESQSFNLQHGAMPVGSVEFVREAMRIAGITEPDNLSYPTAARPYLLRNLRYSRAGSVVGRWFVKPVATKTFTGFVFDTMEDPENLCQHDREQYEAFMAMDPEEFVWISEPVEFISEWRYYVYDGEVVGEARYDDLDEGAPEPDKDVICNCIKDIAIKHPYVVDFGVLSTGETALVEVNDAWAIGLYGKALSPKIYLAFLQARWSDLRKIINI